MSHAGMASPHCAAKVTNKNLFSKHPASKLDKTIQTEELYEYSVCEKFLYTAAKGMKCLV